MKKTELPEFKTEDEERSFWAMHDSTNYVDWSKARSVGGMGKVPRHPVGMARSARGMRKILRHPVGMARSVEKSMI